MTIEEMIERLGDKLGLFKTDYVTLNLRERVLRLVTILDDTRELNVTVARVSGCDARGGRERIRLYMVANAGVVLSGKELEVVGGISEYARRIRELRVQFGYNILSDANNDPTSGLALGDNEYLLVDAEPDRDSAYRWRIANDIRKKKISAQDKILEYLQHNIGKVVTTEELAYVADISEWPRRVRELRTEQGYAIATRFTGRPDLRVGEYILESPDRIAEPHDRHISSEVQKEAYARDNNCCRACGGGPGHWVRPGSSMLELHHIQHHAKGGSNLLANLIVLCNMCHDDVHAGRLDIVTIISAEQAPQQLFQ